MTKQFKHIDPFVEEAIRLFTYAIRRARTDLYKDWRQDDLVRGIQSSLASAGKASLKATREAMAVEMCFRYLRLIARKTNYIVLHSSRRFGAEEALGDCLEAFWKAIVKYSPKKSGKSGEGELVRWLVQRLSDRAVNKVRERCRKSREHVVDDITLALLREEELRLSDPLRGSTSGADRQILLESLLSELSAKQLEAVRECCLGGMTLEEFAASRGTKKAAASRLLARALKKMRAACDK